MLKWFLSLLAFWMSIKVTPGRIATILSQTGATDRDNAAFFAPETLRVASVQLRPRRLHSLREYLAAVLAPVKSAVSDGAQLVVMPEYVGLMALELIPFHRALLRWLCHGTVPKALAELQPDHERLMKLVEAFDHYLYETYTATFSTLARVQKVYIVAGTSLFYEEGRLRSRSVVFGPDGGQAGTQEKTGTIGLDRALELSPTDEVEPISTPFGSLGVVIGSDAYYFECFKILAEKGARVIAAPCSGSAVTGELLRCRANETGIYVIHSCYCGNGARAGIFAPIDSSPQHDGVISDAPDDRGRAVTARTNLLKLELSTPDFEPNDAFIYDDYLHSYRYCGTLPIFPLS